MMITIGRFNHWHEIFGRGVHMKSSSIYGTIYVKDVFILPRSLSMEWGPRL